MSWLKGDDESSLSIADMVAEAAASTSVQMLEEFLPGYSFCHENGMWFNPQSGYYYDSNTRLFYHAQTQTYYFFNEKSQTYQVYQRSERKRWLNKRYKKRVHQLLGRETVEQSFEQVNVDVTELLFELVDRTAFYAGDYWKSNSIKKSKKHRKNNKITNPTGFLDGFEIMPDSSSLEKELCNSSDDEDLRIEQEEQEFLRRLIEEQNSQHASCIRLIEESNPDNLVLHIITIAGAKFGFIGSDVNISLLIDANLDIPNGPVFMIQYCDKESSNLSNYQLVLLENLPICINGKILKVISIIYFYECL